MKEKVSKIWYSSSARNVGKLLSANVIAQAVGILVYPVLTRMYAPEDFGLLSLFLSIAGVLIILSTLEWNKAIVLPQKEEEACAIVHISLLSLLILTLVLICSIPFGGMVAKLFNTPELTKYYWLLPGVVFLTGVWNVMNYWFLRHKAYNGISGYQVAQSLFSAGYKTGFGFLGISSGLIYASVLAPLCSLLVTSLLSAKNHLRKLLKWNWSECQKAARQYSNFPKYSLPHSLINFFAAQLPVLLLTPFFSVREVGFWSMAILLSYTPICMLTNALYQVFFQRTADLVNARQSIARFYYRFTITALVCIIPSFICLWFVLPALTQWLLGDEWRITGEYIRWLLPWLACVFLCGSTGYLFDVFYKQKHGLVLEIVIAVARLIGLGIGIYYHSFVLSVAGYAIASAVVNGIQYMWLMYLVYGYEKSLEK